MNSPNSITRFIKSLISNIEIHPYPMFIMFKTDHYLIKGHHKRKILNIIKEGDILLRRYNHYLGALWIPGYWQHAAYYTGNNRVIHVVVGGIKEEDILTFMNADDIAVLRPLNPENIPSTTSRAEFLLNLKVKYDFEFDEEDFVKISELRTMDRIRQEDIKSLTKVPERFYCSEFTQYLYNYPKLYVQYDKDSLFKRAIRWLIDGIIIPDDILYGPFTKLCDREILETRSVEEIECDITELN